MIAVDTIKNIRLGGSENKSHPIILVGNKSDLVRKRSISREGNVFLGVIFQFKKYTKYEDKKILGDTRV